MFKFWAKFLLPFKFMILDEPPAGGGGEDPPAGDIPPELPEWAQNVEYPEGMDNALKGEASLKMFVKDNKLDYSGVLKSYVNAQKMVGKDKAVIPKEGATDEEWDTFYNKVGRPELESYNVKLKEGQEADKEFMTKYKEVAHKAGLLPAQAEKLFHWYHDEVEGSQKEVLEKHQADQDTELFNLKKDWGMGYDKEVDLAKRALRQFSNNDEIQMFKEAGLTSNVKFIRLMNKIGKGLKEDSFKHESIGSFGTSKDEAVTKRDSMYSDPNGPYLNKSHPGHSTAINDMLRLNEIIAS